MPASRMATPRRRDLLDLEQRLLGDSNDFGLLLGQIPRNIFSLHDGKVILNAQYSPQQLLHHSPIFAFFNEDNELQMATLPAPWRNPDENDIRASAKTQKSCSSEIVSPNGEHVYAFRNVPPLSWMDDRPPVSPIKWSEMLGELIKYSLLKWACADGFDGPLPQPNYETLTHLFRVLKKTSHYSQFEVTKEVEFVYVPQQPIYKSTPASPPDAKKNIESRTAPANINDTLGVMSDRDLKRARKRAQRMLEISGIPLGQDSRAYSDELAAQVAQATIRQRQQKTQQAQLSIMPTKNIQAKEIEQPTNLVGPLPSPSDSGSQSESVISTTTTAALPTEQESKHMNADQQEATPPASLPSDEATPEMDPILAILIKDAKLGRELLSILPDLDTMAFQQIENPQPGFLPLRMLIGTYKLTQSNRLAGHQVWISYKVHDKDGRSAPRMLMQAFHINTGELVADSLKFSELFSILDFNKVFANVRNNVKGEMHFKAIAKYYFILAANTKLHGFREHLMPVNDTFVNDLRTVCIQIQRANSGNVDSDSQNKGSRKRRKLNSSSRLPSPAEDDVGTQVPFSNPTGIKRMSRRFQETSPDIATDKSGTSTPIAGFPSRTSRRTTPRKYALGTRANPNAAHSSNGYLNKDADFADSDGESGDEIPAAIPFRIASQLHSRAETLRAIACHREGLKIWTDRRDSMKYSMRYNKGRLTRGTAEPVALDRELKLQETLIGIIQTRITTHEGAVKGLKEKKKLLDQEFAEMPDSEKHAKVWEAMREHDKRKIVEGKPFEQEVQERTNGALQTA